MNTIMNINEVSSHLAVSEDAIRSLVSEHKIPHYNRYGILSFVKEEIDRWRVETEEKPANPDQTGPELFYRNKAIKKYTLTASKVMCGNKPWTQIGELIKNAVEIADANKDRDYLDREEFQQAIGQNYNDYLRVCCQLGIISKAPGEGKRKRYYMTEFARSIAEENNTAKVKENIKRAILDTVRRGKEEDPVEGERHAILLLWYYLTLKKQGTNPLRFHFKKDSNEDSNFPAIRFQFVTGLCRFLFNNNEAEENAFIDEWSALFQR